MGISKLMTNFVSIEDGNIKLYTTDQEYKYAFYLYHKKTLEKKMYTDENYAYFKLGDRLGFFKAVFFKKNTANQISVENKYFLVRDNQIIDIQMRNIAEAEGYKIDLYDVNSDITFIVFNATNSTKETEPFGLKFLLSRGYNVIACKQNNNQYQELSFEIFKEVVSPHVMNKKIFLYGSSLGAYCAVYYAGAINGTVIAAAPRNSAHPVMINFDKSKLYLAENYFHKDIIENPKTDKKVYIFLDPHQKRDVYFIDAFIEPVYKNSMTVLKFNYAGHEVLYHLNSIKELSKIIDFIVNDEKGTLYLNYDAESEFSLYGKAENSYQNMKKYLYEYKYYSNGHPVIEKKIQSLKEKINLLMKKL